MPLLLGLFTILFAANDNDVEWNGVSHIEWQDRRPLCPVDGEPFSVYFQAYRLDLTSARLRIDNDGTAQTAEAVFERDRGPYAIWRADVPAMLGDTLSYYIELTDGTDTDYYSLAGVTDGSPAPESEFVVDRVTLEHAPLGATPVTGGAVFRVWAPNATQAWVRGEFNGWGLGHPMTKYGEYFVARVNGASARQQYKFYFDPGAIWKPDARARGLNPSGGLYNSYLENPFSYVWSDDSFETPAFEDMIIYELHVGTFAGRNDPYGSTTIPANFRDVAERVDHLVELGINMVELTPITEFPGDFSAGYNPVTMWAPEWKYGTPDDFKYMVDVLHQNGIGVMLDIVWNHFSDSDNHLWLYDSNSTQSYFRVPNVETPWGSQADFGRGQVREYFLHSALHWLEEYRIDGFRMDATDFMNIFPQEADGWSLMQWFNDTLDRRWINKVAIAEQLPNDYFVTRPTSLGGAGFDAQWHDPWGDRLREAIAAAALGDPDMGALADALDGDGEYLYGPYLFRYFELHDEAWPSSGGSRSVTWIDTTFPHDDFYAKSRSKLAHGLTLLVPGIPAILQGAEWLEDTGFGGGSSLGADRIDWSKRTTYANIFNFFRDTIAVRKTNGSFRANAGYQVFHVNEGGNVMAFQRYDASGNVCVVVANFANTDYYGYRLGFPQAGVWTELLNSQSALYDGTNVGNGGSIATDDTDYDGFSQSALITIPQSGMLVFRAGSPPPPPCEGDLDGDNDVDLSDLGIVLADWNCAAGPGLCAGDLDGDGDTDLSDLGVVLAAYGLPCP